MPKPMKKPAPKAPAKKAETKHDLPGRPKNIRTQVLDMLPPKERARFKR